ncbi:MAG TPA: hypothetical protein VFW49_10305 [Fluviicoccus sp.]|nr:hypothetical protein [Fluviicoccus sp.]
MWADNSVSDAAGKLLQERSAVDCCYDDCGRDVVFIRMNGKHMNKKKNLNRLASLLCMLAAAPAQAQSWTGSEIDGYFYPGRQAWVVRELWPLLPLQKRNQIRRENAYLGKTGATVFLGANFVTIPTSERSIAAPACFVREGADLQAVFFRDSNVPAPDENFKLTLLPSGDLMLQARQYAVRLSPLTLDERQGKQFGKFENAIRGYQDPMEIRVRQDAYRDAATRAGQTPDREELKRIRLSLMGRGECELKDMPREAGRGSFELFFPQLGASGKTVAVDDGEMPPDTFPIGKQRRTAYKSVEPPDRVVIDGCFGRSRESLFDHDAVMNATTNTQYAYLGRQISGTSADGLRKLQRFYLGALRLKQAGYSASMARTQFNVALPFKLPDEMRGEERSARSAADSVCVREPQVRRFDLMAVLNLLDLWGLVNIRKLDYPINPRAEWTDAENLVLNLDGARVRLAGVFGPRITVTVEGKPVAE